MPNLAWERRCWSDGYQVVAGVDEAGRGALAGPIVAAAVVFRTGCRLTRHLARIDDSKRLSARNRTELAAWIREQAQSWSIAEATSSEIDELGISRANRLCIERALAAIEPNVDVALIDALTCEYGGPQIGLIDGDAISTSIAAASILAKTHRDDLMHRMHVEHDRYGFDRHVGYGTEMHLAALRSHGPCSCHRLTFAGVLPAQSP